MKNKETRTIVASEVRVKRDADKRPIISGYAAMFNALSDPLKTKNGKTFREKISPGAFKRSLGAGTDIVALSDHDPKTVMARTSSKTLSLKEDERGLAFEFPAPDTTVARDLIANIEHGNVRGVSFGFDDPVDEWEKKDGENIRTLKDVDLGEISMTPFPAYPDTSVDVRSVEQAIAKLDGERRATSEYDDPSILYSCNSARQDCRRAFDSIGNAISTINRLDSAGAELSDDDEQAMADLYDEIEDLATKCVQGMEACDCGDDDRDSLSDPNGDGDMERHLRRQHAAELRLQSAMAVAVELPKHSEQELRDAFRKQFEDRPFTRLGAITVLKEGMRIVRGGHMTHSSGGPALNSAAVSQAKSLIGQGKVDDGEWSFDGSDGDALLGKDDWEGYAKWFLGKDKNADPKTKAAYKYPFGKGGKVYRRAVAAIRSRASQQSAKAIYDAAGELMDLMDKKKEPDK